MRCAVIGGTGYVGVRLVRRLLHDGHDVAVLVRSPHKLAATGWAEHVDAVLGDLADPDAVRTLVEGADAVVHLAHTLERPDFPERDRSAARLVSTAAARAGVGRIVYLGGLRPEAGASRHLASRAEVADVFLDGPVPTVALEASIVVGSGSASFEMIRHLAERVPVLPAVPWLAHRTQPIAIADVLHYLLGALALPAEVDRRFDVGGPDVLSYLELVRRYLRLAGLPQGAVVPVPVPVPPGGPALAGRVVEALTPLPRGLATPLIESLADDLVCREDDVLTVIGPPPGGRTTYDDAVRAALGRRHEASAAPAADDPALAGPTDPAGSGGTVHRWGTTAPCPADAAALWAVVDGIGGDAGWYVPLGAWTLRGWADQLLGGVGGYRGRPHGRPLQAGDVVDGWCVEAVEPGARLVLRSELRQPGTLTLTLAVDPDVSGHGAHLRLDVAFVPAGLAGLVYGRALLAGAPAVFGAMARGITARA
ncbi:DUF2867 domain-containing protein [Actinomycetospora straminea]|uniref:SDR family oxidoreductase n=1 Tax=Actinomycetospora straminea TaxID=663607 RepID=A0ABP9EIF4_9PSEU|nr:DUF2867 domain-containing protein [Actinomycetospora straminea]MDD7936375.1 DUF2867 domain-containing protein [Actinomycetospora straminea]